MRRARNAPSSISNLINYITSIAIFAILIVGSQAFLSSYPLEILMNEETQFNDSFKFLSANQIQLTAYQTPTEIFSGDVIKLASGGYIKLTANQTAITKAEKYSRYKLKQIAIAEQELITWNMNNKLLLTPIKNPSEQMIIHNVHENTMELKTTQWKYQFMMYPETEIYLSTENNEYLYKLSRESTTKQIIIHLVGVYDPSEQIEVKIME